MVTLITSVIGLVTASIIVILIRRDHLQVRYGLWWMTVAIIFALLGIFPVFFDSVAHNLGIAYPPVLALTLAVVVLMLKILVMDIERSRNTIKMQRMIQRTALLESDIRELQEWAGETRPTDKHGQQNDAKLK